MVYFAALPSHDLGLCLLLLSFVQTIRALGLICFVCSVEEENTEELLELFETFFNPKIMGDICKAALDSWGLVASSLSDEILASNELLER